MPNQKRASVRAHRQPALRIRRSLITRFRERGGFTLIETIISMGLLLLVLAFALANYYRGGDDSVLNRETSLLMGRIRLAQEETAAGNAYRYCQEHSGEPCTSNSQCNYGSTSRACEQETTPPGGLIVSFSCGYPNNTHDIALPHLGTNAKTHYYVFSDIHKRVKPCGGAVCFPADHNNVYTTVPNAEVPYTDSIVTYFYKGAGHNLHYGDTLISDYTLASTVVLADIYIKSEDNKIYSCKNPSANYSPWNAKLVPGINGLVHTAYPLQAAVQFVQPHARDVIITDNIYTKTPDGYTWNEMGVMLKLKKRNSDCRAVIINKSGTMTQRVDADCKF